MELTQELIGIVKTGAEELEGAPRRRFMAGVVRFLGRGGQRAAEALLGWNRVTVRKGEAELREGVDRPDRRRDNGQPSLDELFPSLHQDLREIVEPFLQVDPTLRTERLYRKLTTREVRERMVSEKGYSKEGLPSEEAIRQRLNNKLGYYPQRVRKSKPKKIPETDAIFDQIHAINARADSSNDQLRMSVDAKAAVQVGELSRDGRNRTLVKALDHDFGPDAVVVPVGILVPTTGELWIYIVKSPLTADAIADAIGGWWSVNRSRFPGVGQLVVDQDNGPENNSHRTQFMSRMVQLADDALLHVELAYYPPYHSKYNPIERCWAALEHYWNGVLLDSVEAVVGYASNMTWKGKHPVVQLVRRVYRKGVTLSDDAMRAVEARLDRHPTLGRWFVNIDFALP